MTLRRLTSGLFLVATAALAIQSTAAYFVEGSTTRVEMRAWVDVTPTILALLGIDAGHGVDGRVLVEALAGGPDEEQMAAETRIHTVEAGAYRAAIQISEVEGRRYVDKSWRIV